MCQKSLGDVSWEGGGERAEGRLPISSFPIPKMGSGKKNNIKNKKIN